MENVYMPDTTNYNCFVVQNEDVIRAYVTQPTYNSTVYYRDYYINSNYIYKDGIQQFGNYSTLPICLDNSIITNSVYYRNDFANILIIFVLLCIICFGIPLKIFLRMFKRFR